jgi:hypothetical protein
MTRRNYFDEGEDFMEYEDNDERDENEYEEGGEFMAEAKAYERVMYNVPEAIAAIRGPQMEGKLGEIQNKLNKISLQPRERFTLQVNAIYNALTANGSISLTDGEIDIILNHIEKIPNAEYKNPTAYILGYMASVGSTRDKLNRKNIENVLKHVLPKIPNDSNIAEPDVIRYARLWQLNQN